MVLTTIFRIVSTVVSVIKTIVNSRIFRIILTLHKLTYALWGRYKEAVDEALGAVSDFSKKVGLGIDGVYHFLNVYQATTGLVAGLTGFSALEMRQDVYMKYEKALKRYSNLARWFSDDPMHIFEIMYVEGKDDERNIGEGVIDSIQEWVDTALEKTEETAEAISGILEEIGSLEQSLPKFIRDNIPQSIWDGVAKIDDIIEGRVIPAVNKISTHMTEIDIAINGYSKKLSSLADDLKHPGSTLLGVDDLPEDVRKGELSMIDDVTSREFQELADIEREGLSDTIEEFDKIEEALSVPTPSPEFLEIETPGRRKKLGIVEEPRETWILPGDY